MVSVPNGYERIKDLAALRSRENSLAGREIGDLPAVADPERKAKATASFKCFCETYFRHSRFSLPWSADHLTVLAKMEDVGRHGGLHALAMPRGSGKTSLCEALCIWLAFTGLQEFLVLFGASKSRALQMISSIREEIETNEVLQADWPEVCYPIQRLEGIANRCKGQLHHGERTRIGWKLEEIVFPTIPGSAASGAILCVAGITSSFRGMKRTRPDGRTVRPSMVVLDDPQTDASARSLSQCDQREKIISGAVLGLAGPGQKIAAICPCTVIRPDDVADRFLNRQRHPNWTGLKFKLMLSMPKNMAWWEEYAIVRGDELRNDGDGSLATAMYRDNRAIADEGAVCTWPDRFEPGEISAVQYAMNIFFRNPYVFYAEYQNEPQQEEIGGAQLKAELIAARVSGLVRGVVPLSATRLTAFVDVQKTLLYWLVAAWADDFTGTVLDYGSHPDQKRTYFTLADAKRTLGKAVPGAALEGAIDAGLTALADTLLGREWQREDGSAMKIGRLLIDANYKPDTIYAWCRQSPHAAVVMPSEGRYFGAKNKPLSAYQKKPGETLGFHWMTSKGGKRVILKVEPDINFWKSFLAERLQMAVGDKGALTLFGQGRTDHRMFSEHCCAEYSQRMQLEGYPSVEEWRIRPERNDNHFWDCLVGAAAAASMLGAKVASANATPDKPRKRVSYAEMQRRKRA